MTPPAFAAPALRIMPSTIVRATHSTTQSGLSGISASEGTQGLPSKILVLRIDRERPCR